MRLLTTALVLLLSTAIATAAPVQLKLPAVFADNMVLQADTPLPIWGWDKPGATVTVTFANQTKTTKADKAGKWLITLDELSSSKTPRSLTVSSSINHRKSKIENCLVGEVWLCSGQSNMAMAVGGANDASKEIAAAKYPQIRMFTVARARSAKPATNCKGVWVVCDPKTVRGFSATAYFFGRELHKELNVPIGLLHSSWGGTPIEAWTRATTKPVKPEKIKAPAKAAKPATKPARRRPRRSRPTGGQLYNGMIAPLAPYAIRGAIWYQGESNRRGDAHNYGKKLTNMIGQWRALWRQGDFQFIWVQLPNYMAPQTQPSQMDGWVHVQEGMFKTLVVANTGMAVTIDVGNARNIHPKNKQAVGKRLALWTLGTTYSKQIVYSGPLYKSMKIVAGKVVLTFDHADGLAARNGKTLEGFAIAGDDKRFVWAKAKIVGNTVEVTGVKRPKAVRYAWAANPKGNLVNSAGLPASPFRTDTWPK